jgi:hypothetical protein
MAATVDDIERQGKLSRHMLLSKVQPISKSLKFYHENVSGIQCIIGIDKADRDGAEKLIGIRRGVKKVVDAGYHLLPKIEFFCTSSAHLMTEAYHRDFGNNRSCVICLSSTATNINGMVGKLGIADAVGQGSKTRYCEAVVVHELAHSLHEIKNPGRFWGEARQDAMNIDLGLTVSQYAAGNWLEFVAEVFTGRLYGINYPMNVNIAYASYFGP